MYHGMRNFLLLLAIPLAAMEISGELPVALMHRPYAADPLMLLGGERCSANDALFRVVSGRLPEGLRLSSGGYFSGTARKEGNYQFVVRAANNCGYTTRAFTLRVDGAPILLLSAESFEFTYTLGDPPPTPQLLFVKGTWFDLPYFIAAEGSAWITLQPLTGRTPPENSPYNGDPVKVSIDPAKLAPGTYRGYVKATAWQTANEPVLAVTLVVRPGS